MKIDPYKLFEISLRQSDIVPFFYREFYFSNKRKWRVDFCWPDQRLAVEIEGGSWTGGRHTRGKGFQGDMEKYNSLAMMHFCLLRFTPQQVRSGEAILTIEKWFKAYKS